MMGHDEPVRRALFGSFSWGTLADWLVTAAVVVLAIIAALFVASTLSRFALMLVKRAKIDAAFTKIGWAEYLEKVGMTLTPSTLVAWLVKWFVIIAAFSMVVDYLGVTQVSDFLTSVLAYIPSVIIAVVILVVGSLLATMARTGVSGVLSHAEGTLDASIVANVAYYAIMTVTVLAALDHLGIGGNMIEILFMGIVFALSLGAGLAFGLGGKEHAARLLDRMGKK